MGLVAKPNLLYQKKNTMRPPAETFSFQCYAGHLLLPEPRAQPPDARTQPLSLTVCASLLDGVGHPYCARSWRTLIYCVLYWIHYSLPL
jgi:hypothetical protein